MSKIHLMSCATKESGFIYYLGPSQIQLDVGCPLLFNPIILITVFVMIVSSQVLLDSYQNMAMMMHLTEFFKSFLTVLERKMIWRQL